MSKKSPKREGKSDAAAGANPVSFTVKIICDQTQLLESSTTAYDSRFSFHFPGENNPEIIPPVSQWTEKEWKKDFLRNADKDFLLLLEQNGSLVFNVEEKSCPFSINTDSEATTPKSGKKGKSKKPPPKPADLQPGEDTPIVRPDQLDELEFSRVMTFRLQLNSFLIDSNPVSRILDRSNPNGQPVPPSSLQYLKVIVTADTKVMTEDFVKELLPMQLTIIGSEGVPAKPFSFSEMPNYYSPAYASYDFFYKRLAVPEEPVKKETRPKTQDKNEKKKDAKKGKKNAPPEPEPEVEEPKDPLAFEEDEPPAPPPPEEEIPVKHVQTDGLPHGRRLTWEHSEVVFLGLLDIEALAAHFEQNPLCVELHDRDISKEGLKKAAIMSRGDKMSIARMLMVSPEDDAVTEQKEEVKKNPEETPPQSAKGSSRKKGDKKKKNSARSTDSNNKKKELDPAQLEQENKRMEAVAKKNVRGISLFRMVDIFRGSLGFTLTSPVLPCFPPRGTKLKPFQMIKNPYDQESQLSIRVRLGTRLPTLPTHMPHTFNRMVFMFRYDNKEMLKKINDAYKAANLRTLKLEDAPWTDLSTVRLTAEEREKMATSDILTGVQVIDSEYRLIIIEGLSVDTPGAQAMAEMQTAVQRESANHKDYKILSNESITFYERLYSGFDVDIKKIKLVKPLRTIAETKNIYLNKKIPQTCYRAFLGLHQMQLASRLRMVKTMDMFPSIHEMLALEKWYGDFVSDEDLALAPKKKMGRRARPSNSASGPRTSRSGAAFSLEAEADNFDDESVIGEEVVHRVDCYNSEYEGRLPISQQKRDATNWLKESMKTLSNSKQIEQMRTKAFKHRPASVLELYSDPFDALELDYEAMRRDDQRKLKEIERRGIYREREFGFRSLVHEPWNAHPKKPHPTRIEDLSSPWIENSLHPQHGVESPAPGIKVATRLGGEFGMPGNHLWNQSVFVGSAAGLEKEHQEAIERERRQFNEKLVVDDSRFHVYRKSEHRKKMGNLDKAIPIVKDPLQKRALKYNFRPKRCQKKVGPITEYEPSMYTEEDYVEPEKALRTALLRTERPRDPQMHANDYRNAYPFNSYAHKPRIKSTKRSVAIQQRRAGIRSAVCPVDPADLRPLSM